MPFTDKYKREGKYTGPINEYGQPDGGVGTLRYNNGTLFEGIWKDGMAVEMDVHMDKASKNGFSGNWKSNTLRGRTEQQKRKEQDMDDLRSFISQSVRPGSGNLSNSGNGDAQPQPTGRDQRSSHSSNRSRQNNIQQQQPIKDQVNEMPWEDVNGFSGHYTGDVNADRMPDGRGFMCYSNGVTEEGAFQRGVYQPSSNNDPNGCDESYCGGGGVPSSSMSVWSLKSSPTMKFGSGGHDVLTGHQNGGRTSNSVRGAPSSVHLGGPYENLDSQY